MSSATNSSAPKPQKYSALIKGLALEKGFSKVHITDASVDAKSQERYLAWLEKNYHGSMQYMQEHADLRLNPKKLLPKAQRIILVRMDYFPPDDQSIPNLENKHKAYISRYALAKDYHKLMRKRLKQLAEAISQTIENTFAYRPFVDSAPVLEKSLAVQSGMGFMGKHTNIIDPQSGSYFFLGSLFIDLDLAIDAPFEKNH